jgi:CO dehydrogenase/acetyl-CoA synthase gamma subunit (corrinoid Fe-S protein)
MPLKSDLYCDQIDIEKYLPQDVCKKSCGFTSCKEWLHLLQERKAQTAPCKQITPSLAYAVQVVLSLDAFLPEIEITQHPVSGILGLHKINQAGPESPILVTGNALSTQDVLIAILSTTTAPFYLLFIDCLGYTVDMAMVYQTFSAESVLKAIDQTQFASRVKHRELILPGITAPIKSNIEAKTFWRVKVGPYCAEELPLFLGELWRKPQGMQLMEEAIKNKTGESKRSV